MDPKLQAQVGARHQCRCCVLLLLLMGRSGKVYIAVSSNNSWTLMQLMVHIWLKRTPCTAHQV